MVEMWSVDVSLRAAETRQSIVAGDWTRRCDVTCTYTSAFRQLRTTYILGLHSRITQEELGVSLKT